MQLSTETEAGYKCETGKKHLSSLKNGNTSKTDLRSWGQVREKKDPNSYYPVPEKVTLQKSLDSKLALSNS